MQKEPKLIELGLITGLPSSEMSIKQGIPSFFRGALARDGTTPILPPSFMICIQSAVFARLGELTSCRLGEALNSESSMEVWERVSFSDDIWRTYESVGRELPAFKQSSIQVYFKNVCQDSTSNILHNKTSSGTNNNLQGSKKTYTKPIHLIWFYLWLSTNTTMK